LFRVYRWRGTKGKNLIMIKTITSITIGTIIFSIIATSASTGCYFTSTAGAEANIDAAKFNDLIRYSFECVDFKNVDQGSCNFIGGPELFNKWLIGHAGFNYMINNGCCLDYEKHDTAVYPKDNEVIPKEGTVLNPDLIKIYAGSNLKPSKPIVYFNAEGDIKEYVEPVNPVCCSNDSSTNPIGSTDIKINFNFTKFISRFSDRNGGDNGDISGIITIGYLNSYKYDNIPVKFTKEYILYQFGRELFKELGYLKPKNGFNSSEDSIRAASDSDENIMKSYYELNDIQKQILNMISPELTSEIETLVKSYNDLSKKYNKLLSEKAELEKQLDEIKVQNSKLIDGNNEKSKMIYELNSKIESLQNQINTINSAAAQPAAQKPPVEKGNEIFIK
jgi:chaperonin cofactor prefoldin